LDNPGGFFRPQDMMTSYIIPALFPQAPLSKNYSIDAATIENYTGKYKERWYQFKASVKIRNNRLILSPRVFGEDIELYPSSDTAFHGKLETIGKFEVTFSKNDEGMVDHMTLRIGFTDMRFDKIK
jgi:hypothetical protein